MILLWFYYFNVFVLFCVRGFTLDGFPGVNVCNGPTSYFGEQISDRMTWLRTNYLGCTHVRNHLVIADLKEHDDISFLQSIVSVDGVLIIKNNVRSSISLPNLKIVRGSGANNTMARNAAVLILNNESPNGKSAQMNLQSLRSVTRHDIAVLNNKNFCYLNSIDWTELLEDTDAQTTRIKQVSDCDGSMKCASTCEDQSYCWGPGKHECQKFSACLESRACSETRRCLKNQCCNIRCAGGCTGTLATECIACRYVSDGTSCLGECPRQYITVDGRKQPNPDFLLRFESFCVKKCPPSFAELRDICVATCPVRFYEKDGKCHSCDTMSADIDKQHTCRGNCHLQHIIDRVLKAKPEIKKDPWLYKEGIPPLFTWKSVLKELENCTSLYAEDGIVINEKAVSPQAGDERVTRADLNNLRNLREIYSSIHLNLAAFTEMTHLTFFGKLEILRSAGSLIITEGQNLQYLGLKRLQELNIGTAKITKNPKLCYMEHFKKRLPSTTKFIIEGNQAASKCIAGGKVCSSACAPGSGCWGPGSEMCIACKEVRAGVKCVSRCTDAPGYYTNSSNAKECAQCDRECVRCWGPEPSQCSECRNVEDSGVCRRECKKRQYLDHSTKKCHACNDGCAADSSGVVCTGPSSKPGPGGCNLCSMVEFAPGSSRVVQCRKSCPEEGFFSTKLSRADKNSAGDYINDRTKACRKCHDFCRTCDGESNNHCFKCKPGYLKFGEKQCLEVCPSTSYQDGFHCKYCHKECQGCRGPSQLDCKECLNKRVWLNESTGTFKCAKTCPPSAPLDEYRKEYDDRVCFAPTNDALVVAAVVCSVVIAIIIICVIILIVVMRRRKQLLKERDLVHAKYSRRLEEEMVPLSQTDQKPNYNQLQIISSKHLEKGNRIGTGQFGTVFRGTWTPEIEKGEVDVKIDVAIKELKSSDNATASKEFLSEAHVMASVNSPYCVHLLGVSLVSPMKLVSVFVPLGNLTRFMPKHRSEITSEIIMTWALQIAKGMDYLESRGIVHRDLAARNVLLQNMKLVRITDFGLAKLVDPGGGGTHTSEGGPLPVQWLAIECLRLLQFSHKSDVWAYGVTLWEILTFASKKPYGAMKMKEIVDFLENGERLEQPQNCSNDFFLLLLKCWVFEEDGRPTFEELVFEMRELSKDASRYITTEEAAKPRIGRSRLIEVRNILRRSTLPASDAPDNSINPRSDSIPVYEMVVADIPTANNCVDEDPEDDAGGYLLPDRFGPGPPADDKGSNSSSVSNEGVIRFAPRDHGRRSDGYMAVSTEV